MFPPPLTKSLMVEIDSSKCHCEIPHYCTKNNFVNIAVAFAVINIRYMTLLSGFARWRQFICHVLNCIMIFSCMQT